MCVHKKCFSSLLWKISQSLSLMRLRFDGLSAFLDMPFKFQIINNTYLNSSSYPSGLSKRVIVTKKIWEFLFIFSFPFNFLSDISSHLDLVTKKKKNSHHTHLAWIIFFEHFQHRANSRAISCEAISNIHFQVIKSKHFLGSSCKDDMRNVKNAEDASIKKRQLSHLWHLCKGAFEMTSQFSYLWKSDKNLVTTFGLLISKFPQKSPFFPEGS